MFRITDHLEFNSKGRASCPNCESIKGKKNTNLSLVPDTNGAYKCHAECTSEQIRAALGKQAAHPTAKPPANVTVSPQRVREANQTLLTGTKDACDARTWLAARGITIPMMEHYQLGLVKAKCGDRFLPAISIPLPANPDRTQFYQKKRVAPWLPELEELKEYKRWSQLGVPAMVWVAHRQESVVLKAGESSPETTTWLCEGEWDAMILGWQVKQANLNTTVATYTCGAPNVPPKEELEKLQGIVYCFYDRNDIEKNGKRVGDKGAENTCAALGDRGRIAQVPMPEGCEVKGWDVSNALMHGFTLADFQQAASAATFLQPRDKATIDIAAIAQTRKGRLLEALRNCYGERLCYSTMSKQVELDDAPIDPDFVYLSLLEEGVDVGSKEFAIDAFLYLAKKHQYNPVGQYLEGVAAQFPANDELLSNAATRYLGNSNPLPNSFLRKTLIAAVARALKPGCKVDTALILVGGQGIGKSSFWSILAGEWFCDSLSGMTSDTDEKIKLYSAWIHEWAELEQVFKRKETSQVKAFLSATHDTFRQPWGRSAEKHARHSVIVGTTNEDDFLSDSSGSRRYWVVPLKEKICLELLERERDQLWAAAVHAYRNGAPWTLSQEEAIQSERQNKQFQKDDPWFETIAQYANEQETIKVSELLETAIGLELARHDRAAQMRVADCLKSLGWQKRHTERGKIWIKGSQVVSQHSEPVHSGVSKTDYLFIEGSQEVVSSQNKGNQIIPDHVDQVDHPDYMPKKGSQGEVVSPESAGSQELQAFPDYLTTKNSPKLPSSAKQSESEPPRVNDRNVALEVGDEVEVLAPGSLQYRLTIVRSFKPRGVIVTRSQHGYVDQEYQRSELRLVKRGAANG